MILALAERRTNVSRPTAGDAEAETERAILAGGCFWGLEDLLRRARGLLKRLVFEHLGERVDVFLLEANVGMMVFANANHGFQERSA